MFFLLDVALGTEIDLEMLNIPLKRTVGATEVNATPN